MDIALIGKITAVLGMIASLSLLYFLGTMKDEDFDKMIWYWNSLNKHFILSAIVFIMICIMELLELISNFTGFRIGNFRIAYYSIISFTLFVIILNIVKIITKIEGLISNLESSMFFSRFSIILLYIIVILISVDHVKDIYPIYYFAEIFSEVVYVLSIPIIIHIVFRSIKYDKLIRNGIIVVPPHIPAKFLGVATSFILFSAAFIMLLAGNEKSYDILEFGALIAFVLAGDSYRRDMDKALKLVSSNLHRK